MVARLAKLSLKGRFGISDSDLGAILRFPPHLFVTALAILTYAPLYVRVFEDCVQTWFR